MKYNSQEDIKGFDLWERIKCWIYRGHYFMTPDDITLEWCGYCGKIKKLITQP